MKLKEEEYQIVIDLATRFRNHLREQIKILSDDESYKAAEMMVREGVMSGEIPISEEQKHMLEEYLASAEKITREYNEEKCEEMSREIVMLNNAITKLSAQRYEDE
jgi:hypothetical protein